MFSRKEYLCRIKIPNDKKLYLLLLLTVSVFVGCGREPIPEPVPEPPITPTDTTGTTPSSVESFEARLLHTAEGDLPYRMGYFNPDCLTGKPALVLYMHSANGRGSDNISQLRQQKAVDSIFNYLVARRWPALPCIAPSAVRKRNGGLTTCSR